MKFPELLDHSCFKAFWFAARTLNFSLAATEASMTQSGVSQHIQKLEKNIGKRLFKRTSKVVELTTEGRQMLQFVEAYLDLDAAFRSEVLGIHSTLSGDVRYAMPLGCLMSPHFEQLLEVRRKQFPDVQLKVSINHNHEVADLTALGKIDFGFMTEEIVRSDLQYEPFCKEQYVLVGKPELVRAAEGIKKLEELPFVVYPGFRTAFERWALVNAKRSLDFNKISVAGEISDLRGVVTMLKGGVGLTVLAKHCIASELKAQLKVAPHTKDANNQIYIVSRKGIERPLRVKTVMDAFFNL